MTNYLNIPPSLCYGPVVRQSNETAGTSRLLALHNFLLHSYNQFITTLKFTQHSGKSKEGTRQNMKQKDG